MGDWVDSTVDLMNEINVYGCKIYSAVNTDASTVLNTLDKSQFPLFALNASMINVGTIYWLRDEVGDSMFACVTASGAASRFLGGWSQTLSGDILGVRPSFCLVG